MKVVGMLVVSLRGENFGFWWCCRTSHSWKLACFLQVFAEDNVPGQMSTKYLS